jgi:hypothetical protein
MANSVLPEPAAPVTSVGRPCGSPPWVISSKPVIPVGTLASDLGASWSVLIARGTDLL